MCIEQNIRTDDALYDTFRTGAMSKKTGRTDFLILCKICVYLISGTLYCVNLTYYLGICKFLTVRQILIIFASSMFFYVSYLMLLYIQIFVRNTFTNEFTIHIINSPFLSDNEVK